MPDTRPDHPHRHVAGCGYIDSLHGGHLHYPRPDGSVEEHRIGVSETVHGPGCGHESVPHDDHPDYLVGGRLHHPHGDHCDDTGRSRRDRVRRPYRRAVAPW